VLCAACAHELRGYVVSQDLRWTLGSQETMWQIPPNVGRTWPPMAIVDVMLP